MRNRSTVRWLIALAAILLAVSAWSVPGRGGAQEGAGSLRVMTYNIKHGQGNDECTDATPIAGNVPAEQCAVDLERTAKVIEEQEPDIAAIQEVDRFWARSGGVDQPDELLNELDMQSCFAPNLEHGPDDHATEDHEYGTLILSRFPIVSCENTLLPTADGWEKRGLLEARIDVEGIGEVAILGTHLQSNRRGEEEEAVRLRTAQVEVITERVASIDVPVVLMGDLNAEPNDPELDQLFDQEASLQDTWAVAGDDEGPDNPEGFTVPAAETGDPENRIDYIFATSAFAVDRVEVVIDEETRMASDHYPVVADLTFGTAETSSGGNPVVPSGENGDDDPPGTGNDGTEPTATPEAPPFATPVD